ncbi:MAG: stage III sporulation protein AD [Eubacterium sp.]|nr:stage III sporulation protein AD [Eubacterium sp.]
MNIVQLSILAVVGVLLALVIKKERPEYGIMLSIVVCICIFFSILGRMTVLIDAVERMRALANMEAAYLQIVLKMIGITYVAEFSVNLCKDAGYTTIASQIEMFSKISILLLALPIIEALLNLIATVAA